MSYEGQETGEKDPGSEQFRGIFSFLGCQIEKHYFFG